MSDFFFFFKWKGDGEFLWTFAAQCWLCFCQSCQVAGSYDWKNKNSFTLWKRTDICASRLIFLEETEYPVRYRACVWCKTTSGWRTGGWHFMYSWKITSHSSSLLCLSWSRRFMSEDRLVCFTKRVSSLFLLLDNHLGWKRMIQLRMMCSSVGKEGCRWVARV